MTDMLAFAMIDIRGDDPADRQMVAERLEPLGLHAVITGQKGEVVLPAGAFSGVFPVGDDTTVEDLQNDLIDKVTQALELAKIHAHVMVVASRDWSWHFRPVPRTQHSDRHTAVKAPRQRSFKDRERNRDSDF